MNSLEDNAPTPTKPFLSGLAPVFDALARQAAPLMGLTALSTVLIGIMYASAVFGNSIRVDLPLRPRIRTNPHAIFAGENRKAAIKLLRILRLPVENHLTDILDATARFTGSRRSMQQELDRSRDGLTKLEQRAAILRETITDGKTEGAEKELAQLAARLGIRYSVPEALRRHVAALRLHLRQMLVVSPLEVADLDAWWSYSIDGHVMEYLADSGELKRLLAMNPRHLDRLARFRLESCLNRGIDAHKGKIGNHPRPATLWFTDTAEVDELYRNPRLRQHRYVDPFVVVGLPVGRSDELDASTFFDLWRGFVLTLLHRRLQEKQLRLTFAPEAWSFIDDWLQDNLSMMEWFSDNVALPSLIMVAAMNSSGLLHDLESRVSAVVALPDAEVAIALLGHELVATAQKRLDPTTHLHRTSIEKNLEGVLSKLSAKGPLTRRAIIRSFHQISTEELDPLLQEGIQLGLILERDGRYHSVESTVASRDVSVSGVSAIETHER